MLILHIVRLRQLVVLGLLCMTCSPAFAQTQPNILLIIADDMGVDVSNGFLESGRMPQTPNIDALRNAGLRFSNTWATPLCAPTRAAIMSAKHGVKTGVMSVPGHLDTIHESIFSKLKAHTAGEYATALFGKWHISNPVDVTHPAQHGVDYFEGIMRGGVDDYYNWVKTTNGEETQVTEYATTHLTTAASNWIADQTQPWFVWLAHLAPHDPFHVPPDGTYSITNTQGAQNRYLAAIEAMDYEIGRLLTSMDAATLANTLIIFMGDNGTPGRVIQGFASDHSKGSLYEGGIRVPLFFSGKGVSRRGEEETQLAQVTDLHATILEYIGLQLPGGTFNSRSLKPLLSCETDLNRTYIYTDTETDGLEGYAIRNATYKLIEYDDGASAFYDLRTDLFETNNLIDNLEPAQALALTALREEAAIIRQGWSCQDGIRNGTETTLDDCENNCPDTDNLSTENIGCCAIPEEPSVYYEYLEGEQRNIYTNNFPNHSYCFNPNLIPTQTYYHFQIARNPVVTDEITPMVRENGRPRGYFGVAKNGVIMAPAPAAPFIFENPNTGQLNWDWVFEPTNNQGNGPERVALDCASAHTGPQGYHYHGNMYEYMEQLESGITTTREVPADPFHIGWAADGHPILYRFGPDADGQLKELLPSYELRSGMRPGDGITEPCGPYTGKYTRDYAYRCGKGDLDECNGIAAPLTLTTASGTQQFNYFYVITSSFPQIPRCLVGQVSADFDNSAPPLSGMDGDGDGFIADFDCDDTNPAINPLALEVDGNDIDENCDGLLTAVTAPQFAQIKIWPNPSSGKLNISCPDNQQLFTTLSTTDGRLVAAKNGQSLISYADLEAGAYFLQIRLGNGSQITRKILVHQ